MVKVLIIEDQDMARVALSVVLSKNPNIEIADMAVDGQEGVDKACGESSSPVRGCAEKGSGCPLQKSSFFIV